MLSSKHRDQFLTLERTPLEVNEKDGSRQDKSYGLGRVVFHQGEPAVAEQVVSI